MGEGLLVGLALLFPVVIGLAVYALIPAETPRFTNPSTLDVVFASRFTITVVRVAILFGGIYAVVSVVALISRGQWLSSVGPFKVSDSVQALERQNDQLTRALDDAIATIETLEAQVEDTKSALEHAEGELSSVRRSGPAQDRGD
ncbi:MAG: hypothetical protein M3066_16890 [Actinomycetota bacterium]|nr:hypothetical protein [Actinomycetota bacterium]